MVIKIIPRYIVNYLLLLLLFYFYVVKNYLFKNEYNMHISTSFTYSVPGVNNVSLVEIT